MSELKPCPFCGSKDATLRKCHANWGYGWHVTCNHCLSVGATAYSDRVGKTAKTAEEKDEAMKQSAMSWWNRRATTGECLSETEAVTEWNTRTDPEKDRLQQENKQLRERMEQLQIRQTPQKPTDDECCPICGCYLKDEDDVGGAYCPSCGQKIDWIWSL